MLRLQHHWYRKSLTWLTILLLPFSWIFRVLVSIRRFFYRTKLLKSYSFSVPIIVVGNITVGGTGKTPFVIWLAKFLKSQGFEPGIVSRGVGGKQQREPRWVEKKSDPRYVGDEAILLARLADCPVVIGIDRVATVKELLSKKNCNIIICDDGLQHYRLARDIEIVIVDADREFGNRCFIPAGPLRESPSRLKKVDFVVQKISEPSQRRTARVNMQFQGNSLINIRNQQKILLENLQGLTVHAVVAIGNPRRFFEKLRQAGLKVIEHIFPDHYLFQAKNFRFNDNFPIIMTEKDAVKCESFSDERFFYLPVEIKIENTFETVLLEKIRSKHAHH